MEDDTDYVARDETSDENKMENNCSNKLPTRANLYLTLFIITWLVMRVVFTTFEPLSRLFLDARAPSPQ